MLFEQLQQHIGQTVTDVQHWTTCKNPTALAGLVPLIVQAATAGDETAICIAARRGRALQGFIAIRTG